MGNPIREFNSAAPGLKSTEAQRQKLVLLSLPNQSMEIIRGHSINHIPCFHYHLSFVSIDILLSTLSTVLLCPSLKKYTQNQALLKTQLEQFIVLNIRDALSHV